MANLGDTSDGSVPLMNKCVSTKLSGVYSLANWAGMVSSSTFTELIPPGLVNFEFFSNKLFKSSLIQSIDFLQAANSEHWRYRLALNKG